MNKQVKSLLIVLSLCLVSAGLVVLAFLLDPSFVPDLYRISSLIIVVIWAFFIIPTLIFAGNHIKAYCEKASYEQAFRSGVRIGLFLGFGGLILLCVLLSPIVGTIWFVESIKEVKAANHEKKRQLKEATDDLDIFDI